MTEFQRARIAKSSKIIREQLQFLDLIAYQLPEDSDTKLTLTYSTSVFHDELAILDTLTNT